VPLHALPKQVSQPHDHYRRVARFLSGDADWRYGACVFAMAEAHYVPIFAAPSQVNAGNQRFILQNGYLALLGFYNSLQVNKLRIVGVGRKT